ncbi:MAG: hypothetical protein U0R17_05680 [Acidimicrobiia bacterium]
MTASNENATFAKNNIAKSLFFFLSALILIAVALASITFRDSKTKSTHVKAQTVRLSETSDTNNPVATLFCENPIFTIALSLDRSGSVTQDNPAAPGLYKDSVNRFLQKLYDELVDRRHGKVNVIVNAFGSRSVNQNPKSSTGELSIAITDSTSLNSLKSAVDRIYFADHAVGNDPYTMSRDPSDPYDIARGYNAGSYTSTNINFSATNWDDALLDIKNIGSSPMFSSFDRGKHIDLALMLTDGKPNVNNDSDRVFQPSDVNDSDHSNRSYIIDTVNELRQGQAGVRPPMDVRGVLINSDEGTSHDDAVNAMNQVFGADSNSWLLAENFDSDLQKVLDAVLASIDTDEECHWEYVYPKISVQYYADAALGPNNNLNIYEGAPGGTKIFLKVCNLTTNAPLKNPRFSYSNFAAGDPGYPLIPSAVDGGELAPAGQPGDCVLIEGRTPTLGMGQSFPSDWKITVRAEFTPTKSRRLDPALKALADAYGNFYPMDSEPLRFTTIRETLPS